MTKGQGDALIGVGLMVLGEVNTSGDAIGALWSLWGLVLFGRWVLEI